MAYDEREAEPFSEPETENATKFFLNDVPEGQRQSLYNTATEVEDKWTRFYGYNSGRWNGNWADNEKLRKEDNKALLDAIAGFLGMTKHQRERMDMLLHDFPYSTYSPYYPVLYICLITCLLVANVDYDGEKWIYYPTGKYESTEVDESEAQKGPSEERIVFEQFHETFESLIQSLGVDKHKLEKGIPKFRYIFNKDQPDFSPPI